jgi:membrane protein DedA with SNARE-associated domain
MGSLLAFLLSYLLLYKYTTLFVISFVSAVFVPLPANAILLAVGAFANHGYFNLPLSFAVAFGGNVLGDLFDFLIAKRYGDRLIRILRINRSRFFNQLEEEVRRDAGPTIFMSRFAGSLDPIVTVLAGSAGVPFWMFFANDAVGNGIQIGAVLTLGYLLGDYWQNFSGVVNIVTGILVVAILFFMLFRISRRITRHSRKN